MIEITIKLDSIDDLEKAVRAVLNMPTRVKCELPVQETSKEVELARDCQVTKRRSSEESKNEIVRMYKEGKSYDEIAEALGLKPATIRFIVYRLKKKGEIAEREAHRRRTHRQAKILSPKLAYCQNAKCPDGGAVPRDTMVKRNNLLFCSEECADAWEENQQAGDDPAVETTDENP